MGSDEYHLVYSRGRYPMNARDKEYLAMSLHEINVSFRMIQGMMLIMRGLLENTGSDRADVCWVVSQRLNEQVQRNNALFPDRFRLHLTDAKRDDLVAHCVGSLRVDTPRATPTLSPSKVCRCKSVRLLSNPRTVKFSNHCG